LCFPFKAGLISDSGLFNLAWSEMTGKGVNTMKCQLNKLPEHSCDPMIRPSAMKRPLRRYAGALLLTLTVFLMQGLSVRANDLFLNFGSGTKTNAAAIGANGDAWNLITAPTTVASSHNSTPIVTCGAFSNLVWESGNASPVEIVLTNLTSASSSNSDSANRSDHCGNQIGSSCFAFVGML
jgi:hypothetical protein